MENGTYAADSAMSSPNTSGSQTDNCADPKTISLSQPITSLPLPEGNGRLGLTAPDRRTYKRWAPSIGRQPNKKFRMYACARTTHESPREWASKHCQRVWKAVCSRARQWSLINRLQRRSGQFLPPAACAAACLSATLDARRETFANLETQQTPTQVSEA